MMLEEMRQLDMRIMTASKKSGYGQRRKMDQGSRKDDDEMEESLKLQCENV